MKQQHFMVITILPTTSWILLTGFQNNSLLLFAKVPTTAIPLLSQFEASAVAVRGFNRGVGVHRVTK